MIRLYETYQIFGLFLLSRLFLFLQLDFFSERGTERVKESACSAGCLQCGFEWLASRRVGIWANCRILFAGLIVSDVAEADIANTRFLTVLRHLGIREGGLMFSWTSGRREYGRRFSEARLSRGAQRWRVGGGGVCADRASGDSVVVFLVDLRVEADRASAFGVGGDVDGGDRFVVVGESGRLGWHYG